MFLCTIANLLPCNILDIDECSQGLCKGGCVNTDGSYHCSCPVGYFYDAEKGICSGIVVIIIIYSNILCI